MKTSSLQQIEDRYAELDYRNEALRKALEKDKAYQKLLKEKIKQIAEKTKTTRKEKKKYVLSTAEDYEILAKVKQLEHLKRSKHDAETVALIRTQLEKNWRKHLLKKLNKMLKKKIKRKN